jgi:DNA-binding IclR family transcriptional regulator
MSTGDRHDPASRYRARNSTADRALDILMMFSMRQTALSATEVARHLNVARSTAYRYIQSLISTGFLEESEAGGFRLGPRIIQLAHVARHANPLAEICRPVMRQLALTTGETTLVTRLAGATVFCVDRADPGHSRHIGASYKSGHTVSHEPGQIMPVNAGAAAHLLLAWLPPEELDALLDRVQLEPLTSHSITSRTDLEQRLQDTRKLGYAIGHGEADQGILDVAAPVRDAWDRVIAGIAVAASSARFRDADIPALAKAVISSAELIIAELRLSSG